jgi:hypothetical protein
MIILGVQQAISQLPPAQGQAFTYFYDRKLSTYVRSERLGPTQFTSPRTIGAGSLNARFAVSYFRLDEEFSPIFYEVSSNSRTGGGETTPIGFTQFGLDVEADVTVFDLAVTYGVLDRLDVFLDLPVVLVDASADQTFYALGEPPRVIVGPKRIFGPEVTERLGTRRQSLSERGTFNGGSNVGLGRVGLGVKALLYETEDLAVGAVGKLSLASPSSDEFAGSDTFALFPRVAGAFFLDAPAQLYVDAGYEYDFSASELSRFAWDAGLSMPIARASIDVGVGGSVYDTPIRWTPLEAQGDPFDDPDGIYVNGTTLRVDDPDETELDTNFVNVLIGGKLKLSERIVVSAAVTVPVAGGFAPDAIGTIGLEAYF